MTAFARASLLLAVLFLWLYLSALSAPRIDIRSPGRIGVDPADWWLTIVIEPHPDNRQLIVIADGQPGEYRRSDYALEGEKAARIRQVWLKALPQGCYWFSASVADHAKVLAQDVEGPIHVIGRDGDVCPEP